MNTLITGGTGLLASHLKLKADRPSRINLDICRPIIPKPYDLIVHCAAYTNVQKAEEEKRECFDVNVRGVMNLIVAYPKTPIVYISSEYARNPVNFYSLTKQMAEELLLYRGNCLIIRTLFKATPYPFEKAFTDMFTQGDSVDIIAPLIEKEIEEWGRTGKRLVYVGTGRKTIYDIAVKTKPDVIPNSIKEMKVKVPADYA